MNCLVKRPLQKQLISPVVASEAGMFGTSLEGNISTPLTLLPTEGTNLRWVR